MNAEGTTKVDATGHTAERSCLNCGTLLVGAHCHACGQRAHVHRSLLAFFSDFVAGLLNFEGRFWRTLPMLIWCPGDLTRRYVEGQRARFISPVGLYLFTVFLMFATLGFTGALDGFRISGDLKDVIAIEQRELQQLQRQRAAQPAGAPAAGALDRRIAEKKQEIDQLSQLESGKFPSDIRTGGAPAWVRDAVARAAADPQRAVQQVQEAASKYSWLLIPLSVPVLWLLFPLRRRRMYDHTVFVTYSLSFMMLLVVLAGVMSALGAGAYTVWLALLPPFHMYRQLKGAYQLGRWSALFRTALLVQASILVLAVWAMAILALGLIG